MQTIDVTLAQRFDFIVKTNQTFNPSMVFTNIDGSAIDMDSVSVTMSVRRKNYCATDCGCEHDAAYNQVYKQDFVPTVADSLENNVLVFDDIIRLAPGQYAYDMLFVFPDGRQLYYLKGNFKVEKTYSYGVD